MHVHFTPYACLIMRPVDIITIIKDDIGLRLWEKTTKYKFQVCTSMKFAGQYIYTLDNKKQTNSMDRWFYKINPNKDITFIFRVLKSPLLIIQSFTNYPGHHKWH